MDAIRRAKEAGLYDYQIEGVKWLTKQDNCLLADEQGLGKTAQVLISLDKKYGTLIVCPSHLKLNWRDEVEKWRPDLEHNVMKDGKMFKYPEPGEVVITSYGLLPWWMEMPPRKRKNPMITDEEKEVMKDVVVVYDEAQALKGAKTKKHRKCKYLGRMARKVIGTTGTPIMNRQLELWNICSALGIEKMMFKSFMGFLFLFNGKKGRFGYTFRDLPKPQVKEALRKAMLRRTQADVALQLPDKVYNIIHVETPNKIKKSLDDVWRLYRKSQEYDNEALPAFTEFSKLKMELAESKLSALKMIVEDFEEKGIVPIVFSAHRKPISEIAKRKGWKSIAGGMTANQKHKIKDEFQAGKLRGLGASIQGAGTGLTLTFSNHIIFNDLDWVPANNAQAEKRIDRIGQKKDKVIYYHLVSDHPLDRHIHRLILQKMRLTAASLDAPLDEEEQDDMKEMREAILEHLPEWKKRYGVDTAEVVYKDAWVVRDQLERLLEEDREHREQDENDVGILDDNKARILRLLLLSGLSGEQEVKLALTLMA